MDLGGIFYDVVVTTTLVARVICLEQETVNIYIYFFTSSVRIKNSYSLDACLF